jgi:hypothetical protein
MAPKNGALGPLIERSLDACFPSEAEIARYIFPIADTSPPTLLRLAEEKDTETLKAKLLGYIAAHRVRETVAKFERKFTSRRMSPGTVATILKTVRHYHNGLRGGLLYLAGRITEDTRLHRSRRDRIGAAGPLFAAFDEFTDNPNYVVSLTFPLIQALVQGSELNIAKVDMVKCLAAKGMLRKDEPHLERFYGVVDELYRAGSIACSSEEIDRENPLESLPEKAVNAYQARRILTSRPDFSYAAVAAFMFGNETVAGLLYGKLYKGFRRFQEEYGLSDHGCDYFGDHASEDGEDEAPAFEESHANLMLDAVLMYAELGQEQREQIVKGLHLFLETYNDLVEGLCEAIDRESLSRNRYFESEGVYP